LFDEAIDLMEKSGISVPADVRDPRKLHVTDKTGGRTFLAVRAQDVPTYVSQGAADVGVVGRDVLMEQESDLYQMLDLGVGACRLVLAAKDPAVLGRSGALRVATKYPALTNAYFLKKGRACSVIKLYGSVELAPLVNLADAIVDLVSTGETLRANGLVVIEEILRSTAILVVNRVSLKMSKSTVEEFIATIKRVI